MTSAYEIIDHKYDVVVVGAGGAGLRATFDLRRLGCPPPASQRYSPLGRTLSRPRAESLQR